ncbi:PREDICTED: uncharacterized protein At4g15970-like [Nelumbo nucifera]|uniref:Uncharacterized protein At4g15970-like n=1 Tax=Nelumbo nucifera TaxID=4432 RepID=A0A1U7ZM27_NELNU|nr:PREDICTED: uncharacterized protein At4g15970-like [Nelumbo nucifera]
MAKSFRHPSFPTIFAILLVAFLFFYVSANILRVAKYWVSTNPSNPEYKDELLSVLRSASMADRTVILTTLNETWAGPGSVIDLFLQSFRLGEGTERLLTHLVVVAVDRNAFDRCKSIHPHCYFLTTPASGVEFAAEKRLVTADHYLSFSRRRIAFLLTVLELGYNFVFTDADVMWLRNPFPHFSLDHDITSACEIYMGNPEDINNRADGGFNFVKSNARSIDLYRYWYMSSFLHPGADDLSVFEMIKKDRFVEEIGLEIKYLDTTYFGGFCEPSKDMSKVCTIHANCCIGMENKLHDIRLILKDWKKFMGTALSVKEKRLNVSTSPWRAPNRCKSW